MADLGRPGQRAVKRVQVCVCVCVHFFWLVNTCFCCARFSFFSILKPRDWRGETSSKWPICIEWDVCPQLSQSILLTSLPQLGFLPARGEIGSGERLQNDLFCVELNTRAFISLWHCWLGNRKGIWLVEILSSGLLAWLCGVVSVGFCAQPHHCYRPYYPTARFPSPSSYVVSDEPFLDRSRPMSC